MNNEFYLGIDVGKYQHQATLIDDKGIVIGQSIRFANQLADFESLHQTIKKQLPKKAVVKVGMEATGHYYWHLRDYLMAKGIEVKIFNPIETQTRAKSRIRKVKNDRIDSLIIAEIVSRNNTRPTIATDIQIRQLRELTRFSEKFKGQARFYKQEISTLLERLCPEFSACFSHIFLATPLMVIKRYFLTKISKEQLVENITKTSRGRIKREKAQEIVSMLDDSLGCGYRNENTKLQLNMLLQSLALIEKQIKDIYKQIEKASKKFKETQYLASIRGISDYMASVILSEIGNIDRFSNKSQLTAFAGLDASVKQSGNYLRQQGNHISKRGSKYLRRQLYYAAKTAIIFDPELKEYYQKKKAQGKHYNVIMIATARKILMRVYAVLKQKRLYEVKNIS